MHFEMIIDH